VDQARDLETVKELVAAASAALERSRRRIDDLNVYPVPDGDTGTNLALTARAVVTALEESSARDRPSLAKVITRAALLGARGNSGVILSQIVRGAAEALGAAPGAVDGSTIASALRSASDAAYAAVREPVEGTMLSVIRELAEEAEEALAEPPARADLLRALVRRGEEAVARTPEQLEILRQAGVVDAGGAGVLELLRGLAASVTGEPLPETNGSGDELRVEAIHQELSSYRYCTGFVVEGEGLDARELERELEVLGDSLLVVGDDTALKVHIHTDSPGSALEAATALGVIECVEIANMHRQTVQREERLAKTIVAAAAGLAGVVAVVAGKGNRRLFESLGVTRVIEGGQTMNPSTAEIVAAVESLEAPDAIVLPNNPNVILTAEQAAGLARKPVFVVPARSLQEGLAAMVAYDPESSGAQNTASMTEALKEVGTGAVTIASRNVEVNGSRVRKGAYLGLQGEEIVAGGASFDEVAAAVVERLLDSPREILTLLTGDQQPELEGLLGEIAERHPDLELDVQAGGQPHYPLLLSAE